MVNCSVENRVRLQRDKGTMVEKSTNTAMAYKNYIKPIQMEYGKYPDARRITAFHHCNHCESHPCLNMCPSNAIVTRKNGAVVIKEELCVGCRSCVDACPYDVPMYSKEANKSYKCIMCYDRVENGMKQACVEACPTGAMFSGTKEEVLAEANARAKRYSEGGDAYTVYGASTVNSYVGSLGWVTVAPVADAVAYGLKKNPFKAAIALRDIAKTGGAVISAAAVVGTIGHFMYWLTKRKQQIAKETEAGK
jgi:formate dehydrogenase iron-sulfur subunit